jgi:polyphosphate kinase
VVGHKTHAKMLMVVRREEERLRRYVHLSTGNYHPRTTKLYTDWGLFTCNEEIGADVSDVFIQLTGLGRATKLKHLWLAPFTLHKQVVRAIQNEMQHAQNGKKGRIIAKMNALLEPDTIAALHEASKAGVEIDLIVRGICCHRPQLAAVSDRIRVISIIGRFLEHSRLWHFANGGAEEFYLGSADWMPRNFDRRVEAVAPVEQPALHERLRALLHTYLEDNRQAWELGADGTWVQREPEGIVRASHERLPRNSWGGARDVALGLGEHADQTSRATGD